MFIRKDSAHVGLLQPSVLSTLAGHTGTALAADFLVPRLLRVVLAAPPDAVTDRAIRICHQKCKRRDDLATSACASFSDRRSRSICFRKFTGNSRSSPNDARSRSPISLTIARLCWESTGFRIRVLPATPASVRGPKTKQRPSPLAIVRERLFLNGALESGSERTFGYPRHAPFVDGGRRSPIPSQGRGCSFPISECSFRLPC